MGLANKIKQIIKNAHAEYELFRDGQLQGTIEEVFANSFKINFYSVICSFITDKENLKMLETKSINALFNWREDAIFQLSDHFMLNEDATIHTPGGIVEFIEWST